MGDAGCRKSGKPLLPFQPLRYWPGFGPALARLWPGFGPALAKVQAMLPGKLPGGGPWGGAEPWVGPFTTHKQFVDIGEKTAVPNHARDFTCGGKQAVCKLWRTVGEHEYAHFACCWFA